MIKIFIVFYFFLLFLVILFYFFEPIENFDKNRFFKFKEKIQSKEIKNIYFWKTHKTGGSAFNNVLHRLAFKLKMKKIKSFQDLKVEGPKFFGQHAIHNPTIAERIFPRKNSLYITILRNPVDQFLSRMNYRPFEIEIFENYFKSFYHLPNNFTRLKSNKTNIKRFKCYMRNDMSYDLGYVECGGIYNGSKDKLIEKFNTDFDLILLNEYFDEGMILLKNLLNISYEDVVCLSVNERVTIPTKKQREMVEKILPKMSNADYILYNYWKSQYEMISYHLKDEIKILKKLNKNYQEKCTIGRKESFFFENVPYKAYVLDKNVPKYLKNMCWLLTRTDAEIQNIHFWSNHSFNQK